MTIQDDEEVENQQVNIDVTGREAVTRWIQRHAYPLTKIDPQAPLTDLEPFTHMVRDATVVGLGESARGARSARELYLIKHRLLRFLVERLGFRSLAVEEDWTKGIQLDEYVRTGRGDPRALQADAWAPWQTEEFFDVVQWMRTYNQQRPACPVRFVGIDFGVVRALAYDAVTDYVRQIAPERLGELEAHYETLRPSAGIDQHIEWYRSQRDKQSFIDHARQAYNLVEGLLDHDGHALALQHARVIVSFYESYSGGAGEGDRHLAENIVWCHEHLGDKVVYWGGMGHTANGNPLTASFPPSPSSPVTRRNAGSYLREQFGPGYVSIGLTFHHGSGSNPVPAPSPEFADAVLGSVGIDTYLLDLRAPQPDSVRSWLNAPAKMRLIGPYYDPENDPAYHISGGSLADWFDIVVHCQEVTPTRSLGKSEHEDTVV